MDAQCRGTGERAVPAGAPFTSRSRAASSSVYPGAPARWGAACEAVRLALANVVALDTQERLAELMCSGTPRVPATSPERGDGPSAELGRRLQHVQATVGRYTRERREAGTPVARVVLEVNALVRAAGCDGWYGQADTLMAQVDRWTIRAYHDEQEVAHVARAR